MKWQGRRESSNIEDRRSEGPAFGGFRGFGGPRMSIPLHSKSGMAIFAVLIVLMLLMGADWRDLLAEFTGIRVAPSASAPQKAGVPANDDAKRFVAVVLADTEDAWTAVLKEKNVTYPQPRLVLFRGTVNSGCGFAQAAMGPFYCPPDRKIYIDLGFFEELQRELNAPGDFAQAYVIAHEVGHHVQQVLGTLDRTDAEQARAGSKKANKIQVKVELQADCYAGIWAHHTDRLNKALEPGDIEEAMNAASAIGDDKLQKQSQGYVVPDSFTHGSAAQRTQWFRRGYDSGTLDACDTFAAGAVP